MPDASDTPGEPTPVERLDEHLDEVSAKPEAMQERLDELGEGIEATRRQAEEDDLLPDAEGRFAGDRAFDELGLPEGDERRETPLNDAEFESGF
ncbi:MAG TPA: hypothetical protein VFI47_26055 [Acidimicrobiales bacterium]|nr:hypothetical protein [Acidimicrobiales bacterium]